MTTLTLTPPAPTPLAAPVAHVPTKPRRFALVRHSLTLTWRSLVKTARTPEALLDVTIQPAVMLVIFVYIFGGAISGSTHDYLQYVLPGILGMTIMQGAVAIGVNLNTDLSKGIFDRFRSLPIARSAPLVGAVLGDVVRYVAVAVSTVGVGYLMGFRAGSGPLGLLAGCAVAVVFALCLSWVSVFVGMLVRTSGAVQGVMFLLVMPLMFASNVFVAPASMPSWMQGVVDVNPLTHLVGTMRALMVGGPMGTHLLWTAVWCVGLVVTFLPAALWAYRKRV